MARALHCPSASLVCSLSRSKTGREGEMEHNLVCLAERGREGLELVKQQTNSLVRPSFIQGAFWEHKGCGPDCLLFGTLILLTLTL